MSTTRTTHSLLEGLWLCVLGGLAVGLVSSLGLGALVLLLSAPG